MLQRVVIQGGLPACLAPSRLVSCIYLFMLPPSLLIGRDELCDVQVWSVAAERVADDVRLGQDVPLLFQSLEAGDAVSPRSEQPN